MDKRKLDGTVTNLQQFSSFKDRHNYTYPVKNLEALWQAGWLADSGQNSGEV